METIEESPGHGSHDSIDLLNGHVVRLMAAAPVSKSPTSFVSLNDTSSLPSNYSLVSKNELKNMNSSFNG